MPVIEYIAKDENGRKIQGTCTDVDSVNELKQDFSKLGYTLVKATAKREKIIRFKKRVKPDEVVTFAYRFSGMYTAGLPIVRCLETIEEQSENHTFQKIVREIRQSIEKGASLRKAFGKYPEIFSDFFLGMLEAGEAGGRLSQTLEISAQYLERRLELKRKLKKAFSYPIIVSITCVIVIFFIMLFVAPVFAHLYEQLRVPLPGPTQFIISMSNTVKDSWWLMLLAIGGGIFGFKRLFKDPKFKAWWDNFRLRIPVFGRLYNLLLVSHFTQILGILTGVGVSMTHAIQTSSMVTRNKKMEQISEQLKKDVQAGKSLAVSMRKSGMFPLLIVQLAYSGEEAGILPEMLTKSTHLMQRDIDRKVSSLLMKLEPVLTAAMGMVVGLVLMAMYLPMIDYMGHLK